MQGKEKEKRRMMRQLRSLFDEADLDSGGSVNRQEFNQLMDKPRAKTLLSILEVDGSDIERLFDLLDDGDGHIIIDEFVQGIMKVRGTAKAMDLVALLYHTEHQQKWLETYMEQVQKEGSSPAQPMHAGAWC